MKKLYYYMAAMAVCSLGLTSCSDDNSNDDYTPEDPTVSTGDPRAFLLTQGHYTGIEGEFDVFDFSNSKLTAGAFQAANGQKLGDTPQCGVAYGSKIYLGTFASNTVEIINASDYKSLKRIRLDDVKVNGKRPRSMVAYKGKVYISMYDGYVARLDTTTLVIEADVKVGPNPDIMALHKGKLYVPNTNGEDYEYDPATGMTTYHFGNTASVVDLETFTVTKTFETPLNPSQFVSDGENLVLLCRGDYGDIASKVYRVNDDFSCTPLADATIITAGNGNVYYINQPYKSDGIPEAEYRVCDIRTGNVSEWKVTPVDYASNIAYDGKHSKVIISSYILNGGWPAYDAPGYIQVYDAQKNTLQGKYNIGVGQPCIFFN